jgi:hypothetical protein
MAFRVHERLLPVGEVSKRLDSETQELNMSTTNIPLSRGSRESFWRRGGLAPSRPGATIAPILDAPDSRRAAALARVGGLGHPVRTFIFGVFFSYLAIAAVSILLGLLLTHVILESHGIARDDERLVGFLAPP